jgi:site-specific recombinase XerD
MTSAEFLKKLEIELKISKNSKYTLRNYTEANEKLLEFTKKEPDKITQEDVKAFMAENLSDKSPTSIIVFLSALKYAYSNLLSKDITAGIKRPKKEKRIPIVLTKEEVKSLFEALGNDKSKLMISFIYACGFRVSELVDLKVKDLNFIEKIGHVRQAKGKKDRVFNIPEFLFKKLQNQVEEQKKIGSEYLFSGPQGRLSERNIEKIVRLATKRAGIQKSVHPHTLRHSYATHLLEDGVDIRIIQTLLGHATISTTELYSHISRQQIRNIRSPIDSL